jgi:hypothetical protein
VPCLYDSVTRLSRMQRIHPSALSNCYPPISSPDFSVLFREVVVPSTLSSTPRGSPLLKLDAVYNLQGEKSLTCSAEHPLSRAPRGGSVFPLHFRGGGILHPLLNHLRLPAAPVRCFVQSAKRTTADFRYRTTSSWASVSRRACLFERHFTTHWYSVPCGFLPLR